jgi:hypothetical protein
VHIGESKIASSVAVREARVIEAELMQDGRMQIVYVDFVLDCLESEFVGDAICHATSGTSSGKENSERRRIMIPPTTELFKP